MNENPSPLTEAAGTTKFRDLVLVHKTRLVDRWNNGGVGSIQRATLLRKHASRMQRLAHQKSVIGFAGFVLGAGVIVAGFWLVNGSQLDQEAAVDIKVFTFMGGVVLWGLSLWASTRYLRPVRIHLGTRSSGVWWEYLSATDEIEAAAERGDTTAKTMVKAINQITPGLIELLDEYVTLNEAADRCRYTAYRSDYRDALDERIRETSGVMLAVLAEVSAAASVVMARRDDLLAAMPALIDVEPALPVTALTETTQQALAAARSALADAAAETL